MNVNHTLRESTEHAPRPSGEFDGQTRAASLRELLRKADDMERKHEAARGRLDYAVLYLLSKVFAAALALQIAVSAPPLRPAEAAAAMARLDSPANRTHAFACDCRGPVAASTGARAPSAGPWEFPPERPARRLDGTLLSDPPQAYGAVPFLWPAVPFLSAPEGRQDRRSRGSLGK